MGKGGFVYFLYNIDINICHDFALISLQISKKLYIFLSFISLLNLRKGKTSFDPKLFLESTPCQMIEFVWKGNSFWP